MSVNSHMLNKLESAAPNLFSPSIRKEASHALALAHQALANVPYHMRFGVERKIYQAYLNVLDQGLSIGDAYKSLKAESKRFLNYRGVAELKMSSSDDDFKNAAEKHSAACERISRSMLQIFEEDGHAYDPTERIKFLSRTFTELSIVCKHAGLVSIALRNNPKEIHYAAAIRRMMCAKWWERQIRKEHAQWVETIAINTGFVGKHVKSPHVSGTALEAFRNRRRRNRAILEGLEVVDDTGFSIPLVDCVDASVANPENRRNEMMMRLRGLEEFTLAKGWGSQFWTCTAPTRFHRFSGIKNNPEYSGNSPRDAQQWLCKVWARVRASLKRKGVEFSGIRVAEPHHDGCPHWHMLVFAAPENLNLIESVMRDHLIYGEVISDPQKLTDREEHGFDVVDIDPKQGTAVGYIAKYVSKHIDGKGWEAGEIDFETGLVMGEENSHEGDRDEIIDRVLAWASLWGIRQFQFFNAGKVTAWREVRRVSVKPESESALFDCWLAANNEEHNGENEVSWRDFMDALDKHPIEIITKKDASTYGDFKTTIIGISCGGETYLTREENWQIRQKSAPWTCDNNCTQGNQTVIDYPPPDL